MVKISCNRYLPFLAQLWSKTLQEFKLLTCFVCQFGLPKIDWKCLPVRTLSNSPIFHWFLSTGKTSLIRYLLERDYPGLRIGPEPTTDCFNAVMYGDQEQVIIKVNKMQLEPRSYISISVRTTLCDLTRKCRTCIISLPTNTNAREF